jgi:(2S)-methylsuccinyl-CoA dehydrogenase
VTSDPVLAPDLEGAARALKVSQSVVDRGIAALIEAGGPDIAQVLAYDIAHAAAAVRTAEALLSYGAYGDT